MGYRGWAASDKTLIFLRKIEPFLVRKGGNLIQVRDHYPILFN